MHGPCVRCSTSSGSRCALDTRGSARSRTTWTSCPPSSASSEPTGWSSPGSPRPRRPARPRRRWRGSTRPQPASPRPGLRFGFHNHDGELRTLDDGRTVLDRLLELPPERLFLELDLGWAWFAGVDPVDLVARVAPRAPLVHVKDIAGTSKPRHVPVGDGDVGYADVLPAIRELGVEWLLVEQDEADGSAIDAVRRSYTAVTGLVGSAA